MAAPPQAPLKGALKRSVHFGGENIPHRRTTKRRPTPDNTTYTLRLKTSTERGAGTDANIYIELLGRNGKKTGPIRCAVKTGGHFERGNVDEFRVIAPCVGDLAKLRIWHDNQGKHASWHCVGVQVDDDGMKRRYHFPNQFWLSTRVGDCQISREIACAGRSVLVSAYMTGQRESDSESSARDVSATLKEEQVT